MAGTYAAQIGTTYPGLLLILIDQSGSMAGTKADAAADAVNALIEEILNRSIEIESVRRRCFIGVVGYGAGGARPVVGGHIDELEGKSPWVQPAAANGTPMTEAFIDATRMVDGWLGDGFPNRADCFPPIVINISDGAPNDKNTVVSQAEVLQRKATNDGGALIFNVHITENSSPESEVLFPVSENELPDDEARLLFQISSVIPEPIRAHAGEQGFTIRPGSRALVYRASVQTLVRVLNFGSGSFR